MKLDELALPLKLVFFNTINPPTIILGPGKPELAHKTREFCYLPKIEVAVDAYTEIAQ